MLTKIREKDSFDVPSRPAAQALYKNIGNHKFICYVLVWREILLQVNTTGKIMQIPKSNIKTCIPNLDS